MNKYWMAAVGGITAGLITSTQFALPSFAQEADQTTSTYEQLDLFGDIFERIRSAYVDDVDDQELIRAAINGMLISLDPHSSYLPPQNYEEMQFDTRGEFGGLGIEVTQEEGWVKVVSPMDGTPADDAGIQAGDFISAVNGEPTLGLTLNEAVDLMRGPVGSDITLTIVRDITAEPFEVTLTRAIIKLTAARVRTEGRTIVMRVTTFNEQSYPNMAEGMAREIEAAGGIENIDGFVLDLRNNPGGLLSEAISISDAFLNEGEIVSTRGRNDRDSNRFSASEGDLTEGKPLVVLINGGSASASEIVAGALQDHQRAVVVGTKSFGKGSVQTIMPMQGNGAIRLTTARYYTPSGRSIQALGVEPDIIVDYVPPAPVDPDAEDGPQRRSEADLRGAISNDSLTEDERAQLEADRAAQEAAAKLKVQDNQLSFAIDLIKGITVFGGR
ncbi:MAG: PDZ domain-containing protein [Rhodobacteraceae bacterium]|nr:PDZ domain-containing protein [Paracoccaceae bacterium]